MTLQIKKQKIFFGSQFGSLLLHVSHVDTMHQQTKRFYPQQKFVNQSMLLFIITRKKKNTTELMTKMI